MCVRQSEPVVQLTPDARSRLERVLAATALVPERPPQILASASNEAWAIDDARRGMLVLRVCWRGDPGRLLREAAVARLLPVAVGYPAVLDSGRVSGEPDLTWLLTRRLPGCSLLEAWPTLDEGQRRTSCRQVARMLRTLHGWQPPRGLIPLLIPAAPRPEARASGVIGASINSLPLSRVHALLDYALEDFGVDARLLGRVRDYVSTVPTSVVPDVDDPEGGVVIHADLHLANVWWGGTEVTALLDLEWVRLAPAYTELARLKDNADADLLEGLDAHPMLFHSLREDYPELFAFPDLEERLRLLQVVFELRQLVAALPAPPARRDPQHHPTDILTRLLDG